MRIPSIRNIKMQSNNVSENKNIDASKRKVIRCILFIAALALIIYGLSQGGFRDLMAKAIRICYECIGIG